MGNNGGTGGNPAWKGGPPPKDHARGCRHVWKDEPERYCKYWALRGSTYCKWHGGKNAICGNSGGNVAGGISFYQSRVRPKLQAIFEEFKDATAAETFDLSGEVVLAKSVALQSAQLYSIALELPENGGNEANQKRLETILAASAFMKDALEQVTAVAEKAAKIHALRTDTITASDMQSVVVQITGIVRKCFGHCVGEMILFDEALTEQLRLPTIGVQGTTLTPDQDVLAMDASVPAA